MKKHWIHLNDYFFSRSMYFHLESKRIHTPMGYEVYHMWVEVGKTDIPEGSVIYTEKTACGNIPFSKTLEGWAG